jgi:hypothetical protein
MFIADPSLLVEGVASYRQSSWDRTGRNNDFLNLLAGQTVTLLEETGPGKICHFYWATVFASRFHHRQLVLRAYWDGEPTPSIEAPLGDLFCIPHCTVVPIQSLAAVVNPGSPGLLTFGANLYLPMPFATSARITLTYEPIPDHPADSILFWYHINLERHSRPPAGNTGRFHAQWRRENLTQASDPAFRNVQLWDGVNLDGRENYVALEAEGRGQMVGLHLQVDNVGGGWYGEGDDMVFVGGRPGDSSTHVRRGRASPAVSSPSNSSRVNPGVAPAHTKSAGSLAETDALPQSCFARSPRRVCIDGLLAQHSRHDSFWPSSLVMYFMKSQVSLGTLLPGDMPHISV